MKQDGLWQSSLGLDLFNFSLLIPFKQDASEGATCIILAYGGLISKCELTACGKHFNLTKACAI